jgi:beta-lactamase regulating signal transducer with metallopeptidase domain
MNTLLWWLGQNTVMVAVMIPFVLCACRLFRNRPAVQHVLWIVVFLKFVTPPVVSWPWTVEQVRDSIWSAPVSTAVASDSVGKPPASEIVAPGEFEAERAADLIRLSSGFPARVTQAKEAEVREIDAGAASVAVANQGPDRVWIALRIATIIWIVGAAAYLTMQFRRIVRHASLVRRGAIAPQPLMEEIQNVAEQLGLRPPRALIAHGILSPFVWCLGRLRLIWPESLSSQAEVVRSRGVIAHELAHVRRGDHWVAWLELGAGIVWWWNPLFWFVRRRLRETAEMACDALAIGTRPESRREYAELLLELSAGFKTGAPAPVLAVSARTRSSFERRLSMILSDRVSGKRSSWGILVAMLFALVALPGWSLAQQKPEAEGPDVFRLNASKSRVTVAMTGKTAPSEIGLLEAGDEQRPEASARIEKLEAEVQRLTRLLESQEQRGQPKTNIDKPPGGMGPVPKTAKGAQPEAVAHDPLDLAERYLNACADLKIAKARISGLKMEKPEARSEFDLTKAGIEVERAEKLEALLRDYIKDAVKSASAAKTIAEHNLARIRQLTKQGFVSASDTAAAEARCDDAEARVKQFEAILNTASPGGVLGSGRPNR